MPGQLKAFFVRICDLIFWPACVELRYIYPEALRYMQSELDDVKTLVRQGHFSMFSALSDAFSNLAKSTRIVAWIFEIEARVEGG